MHILIAQFNYTLEEAEFRGAAASLAPNFAEIPGCYEKTWLLNTETRTGGGVYKFRDEAAIRAYLASPLWKGVESTPQFTNLSTLIFEAMEGPTEVTGGMPKAVAAR